MLGRLPVGPNNQRLEFDLVLWKQKTKTTPKVTDSFSDSGSGAAATERKTSRLRGLNMN